MGLFLTPEELEQLTGRVRKGAQIEALRAMGIMHTIRPDGRPLVLRAHIEAMMGGKTESNEEYSVEPDWSALDRAAT